MKARAFLAKAGRAINAPAAPSNLIEPSGGPLTFYKMARALREHLGGAQRRHVPVGEARQQARMNFPRDETVAKRRMPRAFVHRLEPASWNLTAIQYCARAYCNMVADRFVETGNNKKNFMQFKIFAPGTIGQNESKR